MTDSKEEIAHYFRRINETESPDPIRSKSKTRVFNIMAEQQRQIKPLPSGRCNLCGNQSERLVPLTLTICLNCSERFIRNSGNLKVIDKIMKIDFCEYCMRKDIILFVTNPWICNKCMLKISNRHRYEMPEVKKEVQVIKDKVFGGKNVSRR